MELKAIKALTAAALLATATAASAGTAPFSMVSGVTAPGIDVSLSVQQSTVAGYDYDFVVSNSSLMGIVTGVYFESDWSDSLGQSSNAGDASLVSGSSTPSIAGWTGTDESFTVAKHTNRVRISRWFYDIQMDNLLDGIQEGESQTFSFTADTSAVSLADLQSVIGTDGYGVAIRMQGLTADEQANAWGQADEREQEIMFVQRFAAVQQDIAEDVDDIEVTAAPSPTAALAGLVVAGIAGLRRRRK